MAYDAIKEAVAKAAFVEFDRFTEGGGEPSKGKLRVAGEEYDAEVQFTATYERVVRVKTNQGPRYFKVKVSEMM
jgi:hypothetical protein